MSLLRNALEFVKNAESQLALSTISPVSKKMISDALRVEDINQCIDTLYVNDCRSLANSKFILNNRCLNVIASLHSLLLRRGWRHIHHFDLLHLEKHVLFLIKSSLLSD